MCVCLGGGAVYLQSLWHVLDHVDAQPFLPGLLMAAALLPDNLAKETPTTNINRQRLIQTVHNEPNTNRCNT